MAITAYLLLLLFLTNNLKPELESFHERTFYCFWKAPCNVTLNSNKLKHKKKVIKVDVGHAKQNQKQ